MIYIIMGPTCSGKTELANRLIDKYQCPAINFDAFQIYQDMNIGTSKIEKEDSHYSSYHLLDIISPENTFSVMEYQTLARKTLNEVLKSNKDVIMVGGTGLYLRATLYDYDFPKEESSDNSDLDAMDNDSLYELLQKLDPEATLSIHKNNRKRIIRTISIARSGTKKSDRVKSQKHELIYPKDFVRFIFISPNRDDLYKNIDSRVIKMMNDGLINEVKELRNKYSLSLTASQGIGYKEVIEYLDNKISYDDCVCLIQKRTRNYAKRQITFFKNQFEYEIYNSVEEAYKNL